MSTSASEPKSRSESEPAAAESSASESSAADQFGAISFPNYLPRETLVLPFELGHSLAWLYCNQCGAVLELGEPPLRAILKIINMSTGSAHTIGNVNWTTYYILAHGCMKCMGNQALFSLEQIQD